MKNIIIFLFILCNISCHKKADKDEEIVPEDVRTPVTVTTVSYEPLLEYIDLNATSSFQQNSVIKASANGYIQSVNISLHHIVKSGQLAFILKTKEAKALGNTINALDSTFRFKGLINVYAGVSGYVSQLDHKPGDYIQDGEQLAVLSDAKSFGFVLNLPYELRPYLSSNKELILELPDKTTLKGTVGTISPTLDSASQTMAVKINVNPGSAIPQNLIAKVRIIKTAKNNVQLLPKAAVLSDESQQNFWVMKLIDSITAVKFPIEKGLESGDRVEILKPVFNKTDRILLSGNYGMADTAKVTIVNGVE